MRTYKQKECPVCKELKNIPSDTICFDCQGEINVMRKKANAYDLTEAGKNIFEFQDQFQLFHVNIYTDTRGYVYGSEQIKKLQNLFYDMFLSIAIPAEHKAKWNCHAFLVPGDARKAINNFKTELDKLIQRCYNEGVKAGKQLLIGLNSGEYSLNEFERSKINRKYED